MGALNSIYFTVVLVWLYVIYTNFTTHRLSDYTDLWWYLMTLILVYSVIVFIHFVADYHKTNSL